MSADPNPSPKGEPTPAPTPGQIVRRLGPAGPIAVAAAFLPALGGVFLLINIRDIGGWLKDHGIQGVAAYIACFALAGGFALLPTYAQAILGGWAFGLAVGYPAAMLGFVLAAMIGYELSLKASGDRVLRLIEEQPRWKVVVDSLVHRGFWRTFLIVSLVRLPPNSPFAITNLVLASTKVPRLPYLLGTLVGMAPRTGLAVSIGAGLGELLTKDAINDAKRQYVFWGIGAAIAVVLIIGHLGKKALERVSAPPTGSPDPEA